jgi:DNA-binding NarL/FixJ family response regulator
MTAAIRILLADDEELVRAGLAAILSVHDDLEVMGEARDGAEAVSLARRLKPDVTLMDLRMPRLDGIAATRRIVAEGLGRVLALTTFDIDRDVFRALEAGASGFLLKSTPADALAPAVRTTHAGQALLAPSVVARLVERYARPAAAEARRVTVLGMLTAREQATLRLLAEGLSNAEIATRLNLGEATVKSHVSAVLVKLGLRDRIQAAVLGHEIGLGRDESS